MAYVAAVAAMIEFVKGFVSIVSIVARFFFWRAVYFTISNLPLIVWLLFFLFAGYVTGHLLNLQ